jgi:hypothetical protein
MKWMVGCWWAVVGAAIVACAADSGQTGSASCAAPDTCGCLLLARQTLFRATAVDHVDGAYTELRIDEILTPLPGFDCVAQPGFHVRAMNLHRFVPESAHETYCAGGIVERPALGESVLLAVALSWPLGDCDPCRSVCPDVISVNGYYLPFQETYDLDGELLTLAELGALTEGDACRERFPFTPLSGCNDVVDSREGGCGR